MGRAFVIAGVTPALKSLLEGGTDAHGLDGAIGTALVVSALPPAAAQL